MCDVEPLQVGQVVGDKHVGGQGGHAGVAHVQHLQGSTISRVLLVVNVYRIR